MALRTTTKVVVPTVETETPAVETTIIQETAPAETPVAEKKKEVAVKKPAAALAVSNGAAAPSLASLHNVFDPTEIGTSFKRIVASGGSCEEASQHIDLGKYIDVQVLSISKRYMIAPVADDKDVDARKFCRCSYDGLTITTNEGESITIEDYIASVDEYDEFGPVKKYLDIFALIINTENKAKEEDAKNFGIVQISVSPTAMQGFASFELQAKLFIARGQIPADKQNCMRVNACKKSNPATGKSWTYFEPGIIPAADLEHYTPISM